MTLADVLARLDSVRKCGNGYVSRCPTHWPVSTIGRPIAVELAAVVQPAPPRVRSSDVGRRPNLCSRKVRK